jgi:RNA polymerase sigma-70 factor (ECF subfamily)
MKRLFFFKNIFPRCSIPPKFRTFKDETTFLQMTLQEQELIQACKKGDRKAQNAFYDRYKVKMFGVCMRYASNREEAEDMLLEGFFRVFKDLHQFRNQCSVEAWIHKVMINSALMYLRKNHLKSFNFINIAEVPYLEADDDFGFQQDTKMVIEAIQQLPIGFKTIFNLYAIEGFSHKEIAEKMSISASTSRSQYTRAKIALQKLLSKQKVI